MADEKLPCECGHQRWQHHEDQNVCTGRFGLASCRCPFYKPSPAGSPSHPSGEGESSG